MHAHSDGIASTLDNTRSQLDKLHKEITKALEKIESREKYTNSQVSLVHPRTQQREVHLSHSEPLIWGVVVVEVHLNHSSGEWWWWKYT